MRRVLLAGACAGLLLLGAACGGDDEGTQTPGGETTQGSGASATPVPGATATRPPAPTAVKQSTAGTVGGPEPVLSIPASKYAANETDLRGYFTTNPADTFPLSAEVYSNPPFGPFKTLQEGQAKVKEWGYLEGWQVVYEPPGQLAAVAQGAYYVTIEVHLFGTVEGARKNYAHYEQQYMAAPGSQAEKAKQLANQSSAWSIVSGKVGQSQVDAAYHAFLFRRGNMVVIVQTFGSAAVMTVDPARDVAVITDQRALGERVAEMPTPAGLPAPTATR